MGFIKGGLSLTRYRVLDEPLEMTDEYLSGCLKRNAFWDIEATAEEASLGWVELLDPWSAAFDPASYRFGGFVAFGLRLDSRRLGAKTVNRYLALEEARYLENVGRPPSTMARRELKNKVRNDLLRRTPVDTDIFEVVWFPGPRELWLGAVGEKKRGLFEELWRNTFGLSLKFLVPASLAPELIPETQWPLIAALKPSSLLGGA